MDDALHPAVSGIRDGLVVSCQARAGHPLHGAEHIAAMAACAIQGGAHGLRLDGAGNVRRARAGTDAPIIGIAKHPREGLRPAITPTFADCAELAAAGADIVAAEATEETGTTQGFSGLVARVHGELGIAVMADVSTLQEGLRAWEAGADLIGTTLSGYTPESVPRDEPDLDLVAALAQAGIRAVLEGNVHDPAAVGAAFARGAWSVVVGKAITDPLATTARFAAAAPAGTA